MKAMDREEYARDTAPFFDVKDFYEVEIARRADHLGNMAQVPPRARRPACKRLGRRRSPIKDGSQRPEPPAGATDAPGGGQDDDPRRPSDRPPELLREKQRWRAGTSVAVAAVPSQAGVALG
jgi:hypothetical protein